MTFKVLALMVVVVEQFCHVY